MKAVPCLILAVILSCCAPKSSGGAVPESVSSGQQGKTVDVEIVVASHAKLLEVCKSTNKPARTVYVDEKSRQVFHCVNGLLAHANHGPTDPLSAADVPLSAGDQIRWYSETHTFFVVSVEKGKEPPQSSQAPPTPFTAFAKVPGKEVTSSAVPNVAGEAVVVQRYKVVFNITGLGIIDPDVVCSM